MADTNGKIKYLGMEGVEALLEGLKGEYSPLGHEHDIVINAENATNAEHSSTADTATNAEHASKADHAATADESTKAIQDGNGNVIVDTYALKNHEHSWNELNDKPFGEVENVIAEIVDATVHCEYKSSIDMAMSDDLQICNKSLIEKGKEYFIEAIIDGSNYNGILTYDGTYYCDGVPVSFGAYLYDEFIFMTLNCNELHIWETKDVVVSVRIFETVTKQLDEKYIPDSISREGHTHDWSEFGELPENVLVHDAQELTEEEQMQARKNLGLYSSYERIVTETVYSNMYWGDAFYPEDATDNLSSSFQADKEYVVSVSGNEYKVVSRQYDRTKHMVGTLYSVRWIGNASLIESDYTDYDTLTSQDFTLQQILELEGCLEENADVPFVIYWEDKDGEGSKHWYEHPTIKVSPELGLNRYDNLTISTIVRTETVYETIPEEYIPNTIARVEDVVPNAVQYTEQALVEEQQMQARKNLGLYYETEQPLRLYDSTEVWASEKTLFTGKLSGDITVRITQDDEVRVEYDLEEKSEYDYASDTHFTWYGNPYLVNNSMRDSEEGIVLYEESGNWYVFIRHNYIENAHPHTEFTVDIIDKYNTEIIYEKIPEKYIPDTIARNSNILNQANSNSADYIYSPSVDTDLVTKAYVDTIGNSIVPTQEEAIALVTELGFVEPISNNGFLLTEDDDTIFII